MSRSCSLSPRRPARAAGDCILDNCADQRPAGGAAHASPGVRAVPVVIRSNRGQWFAPRVGGAGAPSGDFDFYVLALSWSPSFCATGGAGRSPAQCAPGANPGFVTHGLWPQYQNGYPSRCARQSVSCPIRPCPVWATSIPIRVSPATNGASMACVPARARRAISPTSAPRATHVAIPAALKAPPDDRRLSPLDIQRAFIDANPRLRSGMMAVVCRRGVFQEARFCLSRDLRDFVACPEVARQGCYSQSIVVPAAR